MKISILCSSKTHPVYPRLEEWTARHRLVHGVELVQHTKDLSGGNLLFLISCSELIGKNIRDRYDHTLVIHASDLPEGRGWSPHIWQILEGRNTITVSLLEAEDKVDSGAIWAQKIMRLEGHELHDEINERLFRLELELMDYAVQNCAEIVPAQQPDREPSYYRKRTPEDSRIDPNKTMAEQFDLLRVADPERFPAFFDLRGQRYTIRLEKVIKGKE